MSISFARHAEASDVHRASVEAGRLRTRDPRQHRQRRGENRQRGDEPQGNDQVVLGTGRDKGLVELSVQEQLCGQEADGVLNRASLR